MSVQFQQQHFNAVAKLLGTHPPEYETSPNEVWISIVDAFADYFTSGSESFNETQFRQNIEKHLQAHSLS